MNVAKIMRRYRRMKKKYAAILMVFAIGGIAFAQESPSPTETASASPEQTPSPSPSASASRNVQLRFVPPPMEGTISLGIFDSSDKLVRVLDRESKVDNFKSHEHSLKTTWDGKNDAGEDLPTGKYRARGYAVGRIQVDDLGRVEAPPNGAVDHGSVKLVTDPLGSDT